MAQFLFPLKREGISPSTCQGRTRIFFLHDSLAISVKYTVQTTGDSLRKRHARVVQAGRCDLPGSRYELAHIYIWTWCWYQRCPVNILKILKILNLRRETSLRDHFCFAGGGGGGHNIFLPEFLSSLPEKSNTAVCFGQRHFFPHTGGGVRRAALLEWLSIWDTTWARGGCDREGVFPSHAAGTFWKFGSWNQVLFALYIFN